MSIVYEGSCVLEVDGVEIEITKLDVKTVTGRKLVKTMNSSGRARGYSQGIAEYT
ncbi:phage tail protein, partial [Mannheimia haemolytica]|nr:phage tail protein [Mannheimia haemolytica]MDW0999071.1 phage tail protein [Mannheimia haemolytica]